MEIDPSIPLKLLFLINASSHDKLIAEKDKQFNFSRGYLWSIGNKLRELEHEQKQNMHFNH